MTTAYFQVGGEVKSCCVPEDRELGVIWLALIATTVKEPPKTPLGIGVDWGWKNWRVYRYIK